MKVTLMHNPKAGNGHPHNAGDLVRAFREAGHEVSYQSTKEKGAKWALLEPADLVVAAGGDGTVRKTALAAIGRGVPMAILPLGTANNIARTFGLSGSLQDLVKGLAMGRRKRLDVGLATGPWGKTPFIESAGAGLLARVISHLSADKESSATSPVERSRRSFRQLLESYRVQDWKATLDGRDISGRYLLAEAMITRSAGPNLYLAPAGRPGDGLIDFVFLEEQKRQAFATHWDAHDGAHPDHPPVRVEPGKHLTISWTNPEPVHVDDHTWPGEKAQKKVGSGHRPRAEVTLDIRVTDHPVDVLIPG